MVSRQVQIPPPYRNQYGEGRRRKRGRRGKRRMQNGGFVKALLDTVRSDKARNILKNASALTPLILDQVMNIQNSLANRTQQGTGYSVGGRRQRGGFGVAALLGGQLLMPIVS